MAVLYIVLPLALAFVIIAVGLFIWAAKGGQFDDLETPAHRILFDDESPTALRPGTSHQQSPPNSTKGPESDAP